MYFSMSETENLKRRETEKEEKKGAAANLVFAAAPFGLPDWGRTSGLKSRSLTLYPTELQVVFYAYTIITNYPRFVNVFDLKKKRRGYFFCS